MLLPIPQVSLSAEDDPDASSSKADVDLAAIARAMLLEPSNKPRIVPADARQLNDADHILLLDALDHRLTFEVFVPAYKREWGLLFQRFIERRTSA